MDYLTNQVNQMVAPARVKTYLSLAKAQRELEKQNGTLQEINCLLEAVELIT